MLAVLSIGLYLLCREDADIVGSAPVKALCNSICQKPARSTSVAQDSRASTDSSSSTVTASGPGRRPSKLRIRTKSKLQQGCQVVESTNDMMGDSSNNEEGPIACALSLLDHSEILKWGITGGRQSVVQSDIALHTLLCLAAADTTGEVRSPFMKYVYIIRHFKLQPQQKGFRNHFMFKQIREAIRVEGGLSEATKKICDWKVESESSRSYEEKMTGGGGYLHRLLSWLHFMELATHSCPASAAYVTSEAGGKELLRCLADMVATGRANSSYETSLAEVC